MRGVASKAYRAYVERRQQSRWAFVGAPFGWSPVRPSPRCAHSTYPGTTSRPRLARNTPATTDTSLQVCSTTRLARRRSSPPVGDQAASGVPRGADNGPSCRRIVRGLLGAPTDGTKVPQLQRLRLGHMLCCHRSLTSPLGESIANRSYMHSACFLGPHPPSPAQATA